MVRVLVAPYERFFGQSPVTSFPFGMLTTLFLAVQLFSLWLLVAHWAAFDSISRNMLTVIAALALFSWVRVIQLHRVVSKATLRQGPSETTELSLKRELAVNSLSSGTVAYFLLLLALMVVWRCVR